MTVEIVEYLDDNGRSPFGVWFDRLPAAAAAKVAVAMDRIRRGLLGGVETGLSILGDYVNATVGYKTLADKTGKNPKSLMRMLGPSGNPTVENLFNVISQLKEQEGLEFDIRARHT